VCEGSVDAVTFTASPALRNFFLIADQAGRLADVTDALASGSVALVSVGPACDEAAEAAGIPATVSPRTFRLGAMVQAYVSEVADRATDLTLAGIPVTLQGRAAYIDGTREVLLSDRERDVLAVLARRPGAVVSKATLVREVWSSSDGDEHVVEVVVGRLRQRLGPAGAGIETVVRRGYRLCDEAIEA
jgi:uroporphyrinogen-III synthase